MQASSRCTQGIPRGVECAAGRVGGSVRRYPRSQVRATHAVVGATTDAATAEGWLRRNHPELQVMSAGEVIEIYKQVGSPRAFVEEFGIEDLRGTHALGHTRMATESRVMTEASHPFSTGRDLCLVHNGSLSNHNRLRRALRREGIGFDTENDTEVAAGYLAWRLRTGVSLWKALEGCLEDLDGFYTFWLARLTGSRCFVIQSRASQPCLPSPRTGSRWRRSIGRSRCCRGANGGRGSPTPASSMRGSGFRHDNFGNRESTRGPDCRSRVDFVARAQSAVT